MMPPVLGLQDLLPARVHRHAGACAAAMLATALALPALVDVAPDPASSRHTAVTAFASDSLVVVLVAADSADSVAVLRQMAQDQAALTPPTAAGTNTQEHTAAYKLGEIAGSLVLVGVPVWLVVRAARNRNRPAPVGPDQTAPPSSPLYSASRPGIPRPPLGPSSDAPPPPPPWPDGDPPRRPGIPLPPLDPGSEG